MCLQGCNCICLADLCVCVCVCVCVFVSHAHICTVVCMHASACTCYGTTLQYFFVCFNIYVSFYILLIKYGHYWTSVSVTVSVNLVDNPQSVTCICTAKQQLTREPNHTTCHTPAFWAIWLVPDQPDLLGCKVGSGWIMWPSFSTLSRVVLPALSRPRNNNLPDLWPRPVAVTTHLSMTTDYQCIIVSARHLLSGFLFYTSEIYLWQLLQTINA